MSSKTPTSKKKSKPPTLPLDVEIKVRWEPDDNPDLSHLGEYSDTPEEGAIDREKLGDMEPNTYRYWNPANHKTYDPKDWAHVSGKDKAELIRKHGSLKNVCAHYRMEDYKRNEAYNNQEWGMEGCIVTARIGQLKAEASCWNVESDAGEAHRQDIVSSVTSEALSELTKKVMARLECE